MKYVAVLALSITLSGATFAHAGTVETPRIDPIIIKADTAAASSSSATVQVAMLGLLLLAAAIAN